MLEGRVGTFRRRSPNVAVRARRILSTQNSANGKFLVLEEQPRHPRRHGRACRDCGRRTVGQHLQEQIEIGTGHGTDGRLASHFGDSTCFRSGSS